MCYKRRGGRGKTPKRHLTGGVSTWLHGLVGSRWTAASSLLSWLDASEVLLVQTSNHGSHLPLVESTSVSGELDITLSLSLSVSTTCSALGFRVSLRPQIPGNIKHAFQEICFTCPLFWLETVYIPLTFPWVAGKGNYYSTPTTRSKRIQVCIS